jgi:RHS repeat-associated protein
VVTEGSTFNASTTYDAGSHTLRSTSFDGSWVEYAYDGFDRMIRRQTSTGEVTLFYRDLKGDEITMEANSSGSVTTRYILNSESETLAKDDSAGRGYLIEDPRGNLSQILDDSATVKAVFAYDPFGKEKPEHTKKAAGWDSRLRFQMAPRDPKTGAYNIGPRILDPNINRFVGADFYVGAAANLELQLDPLTGNRYLYAGANPENLIDDGHKPKKKARGRRSAAPPGSDPAGELLNECSKIPPAHPVTRIIGGACKAGKVVLTGIRTSKKLERVLRKWDATSRRQLCEASGGTYVGIPFMQRCPDDTRGFA